MVKKTEVAETVENEEVLALKKELADLRQENAELLEQLSFESPVVDNTRLNLLLALAPQINLNHPKNSAQRISATVDIAMEEWGI